jgi:hypothetical protein
MRYASDASMSRSAVALTAVLAGALGVACAKSASVMPVMGSQSNSNRALPSWLLGVWRREWIERGGVRTSPYIVRYLQTPELFADVRLPIDRLKFLHARSFTELTDGELRILAKQRGFIGRTTIEDLVSTRHHELDFQPPDPEADIGRIERKGTGRMYEHGLDGSFTEAWVSLTSGDNRFLAVRVERAGRLDQILLVAGDYFFYGRNRAKDLPAAASLDSLIATTRATRSQIIAYLDCELSVGRIRGSSTSWEVQYSTLPWREARELDFVGRIKTGGSVGGLAPLVEPGEIWTVPVNTLSSEDLILLFAS